MGVLLLTIALSAQKPFDLKTGDILFQTNKARTSFVKAIENVTTSLDDLNFSHVGVVLVEDGQVFVLEATQPNVCKTPLAKFLKQAKSVDGNPVKLTPIEFKILALLRRNPGRVFSTEEIYERVWNEKAINTDTIMVHVRNIRDKIEINPREPKYLKVVWGVGYKIEKQP